MAIHLSTEDDSDDALLGTINTTPLVDVMLVLLIIFLITIPVVTTSVKVNLPNETQQPIEPKPDNVIVSINAKGQAFWFDAPLASSADLQQQLQNMAKQQPQPELHIRGDAQAHFADVGRVLYAAQMAGVQKVKFLTDPSNTKGP
ncbi:MAG: Biopolymer transport protein ExbD [Pseudomonadota bacterium]|jgi:biopolymer transport protein ExbD